MAETMFRRYGGFRTVSQIVSDFYGRIMDDEQLRAYFVGVDMARQIDHQTKFVAYLMGAPPPTPTSTSPGSTPASTSTTRASTTSS